MATTLDEICSFLDQRDLRYRRREDDIIAGFVTKRYRDEDGDNGILVVIKLFENGEYIKVFCPAAYNCRETPHKAIVLQTLLIVSWRTKHVQFEYDESDGEIRVIIEFPLEDAPLTGRQLWRCMSGIVKIIDDFDPVIRGAIENGVVEWPTEIEASRSISRALAESDDPDDLIRRFAEFLVREQAGESDAEGGGKDDDLGLDD